jgi:flagellar basal-body rod modification protein FlgD
MATGILNHHIAATQALSGNTAVTSMASAATGKSAKPEVNGNSSSTSSSSSDSATISSSDFLTLLVTELQNQDPTANTDPNEYVNQLVSVNSLEQLININSTLTTDLGSSSNSTTSDATKASASNLTRSSPTMLSATASGGRSIPGAFQTATSKLAPGNLGVPDPNPAAQTVAQALSARRNSQ